MGIGWRYPVSMTERQAAAAIMGVAVLVAAFLLATGRLPGAPIETAASAPPQWVVPAGTGIAAPACGSAGASVSCSGSAPSVTITWSNSENHGYPCQWTDVSISGGPSWSNQPCSGSVTWNGAANSTQYSYRIGYWYDPPLGCYAGTTCDSRGSCGCNGSEEDPPPLEFHSSDSPAFPPPGESNDPFTTPNCVPPVTASCSVSPTSTTVGQSVTWTASASGGTGTYSYSWSGSAPLGGQSGNPVSVSYSSPGTKTGSVTVTSGAQSTGPVACSNSVTVIGLPPDLTTQHRPIDFLGERLISDPFVFNGAQPIRFSSNVLNQGTGPVPPNTVLDVGWCLDPSDGKPINPSTTVFCKNGRLWDFDFITTAFDPLPPGQTTKTFTTDLKPVPQGTHTIYWCADSDQKIGESNENNNCQSQSFKVTIARNTEINTFCSAEGLKVKLSIQEKYCWAPPKRAELLDGGLKILEFDPCSSQSFTWGPDHSNPPKQNRTYRWSIRDSWTIYEQGLFTTVTCP